MEMNYWIRNNLAWLNSKSVINTFKMFVFEFSVETISNVMKFANKYPNKFALFWKRQCISYARKPNVIFEKHNETKQNNFLFFIFASINIQNLNVFLQHTLNAPSHFAHRVWHLHSYFRWASLSQNTANHLTTHDTTVHNNQYVETWKMVRKRFLFCKYCQQFVDSWSNSFKQKKSI